MFDVEVLEAIQNKYEMLLLYLNERTRRVWAAMEARELEYGGVSAVAQATGLSRNTIAAGMKDLQENTGEGLASALPEQIRKPGGGHNRLESIDPTLLDDCEETSNYSLRGQIVKFNVRYLKPHIPQVHDRTAGQRLSLCDRSRE
jgi:hypothetical protein